MSVSVSVSVNEREEVCVFVSDMAPDPQSKVVFSGPESSPVNSDQISVHLPLPIGPPQNRETLVKLPFLTSSSSAAYNVPFGSCMISGHGLFFAFFGLGERRCMHGDSFYTKGALLFFSA